jgi:energy-coupling factor transporter ATP-binding protein EcfA2
MNIIQEIQPTKSQEEGIQKIAKFLVSDEPYFVLTGPAGSGKTTIIKLGLKKLLEEPRQESSNPNVYGITVAHQAKNVLANSINKVATFAKAFGYKEKIDELTGKRTFVPIDPRYLQEPPIGHEPIPVFVHDEVSMYSHEMLRIVMKSRSPFSKVIFMGDNAQLPPVDSEMKKDEDSPVFDMPVPDWCKHTLTERVRQKVGNPILDLSDMLREEIFGKQNLIRIIEEILKPKIVNGCGYDIIQRKDLINHYMDNSKGDYLNNKIIAFRNKTVAEINLQVRNVLFNNPLESLLKDDVICLTNNYMGSNGISKFRLENSQNFIVKNVSKFKLNTHFVSFPIPCYYGYIDEQKTKFVITPQESSIHLYQQALDELLAEAKSDGKRWKDFWEFKDLFTEFTMGYSINAYRSQGSTYKNVYLDLIDVLSVKPLTNKRKLQTIYTAITRPTDFVMFIKP